MTMHRARLPTVKSPLRYPGGKARAIAKILAQMPINMAEYREPMVGGGSVFLAVKAVLGNRVGRYWINDLNSDLCCFWRAARDENEALVERPFALDDSPMVRQLFSFAQITTWQLQYGMNNVGQATAQKGNELFIRNY